MKYYLPSEVKQWSFEHYMRVLAQELDENGLPNDIFGSYSHLLDNLIIAKRSLGYSHNSAISIAQQMDYPAMRFAEEIGLLNNGRCPLCGAVANGAYEWVGRDDRRRVLKICRGCRLTHGGGTGHGSGVIHVTAIGRFLDKIIWGD